ncbi:MAG: hypothetical protein ACREPY_01935 [Rhodanobacteraceae bacterium]
MLILRERNTQLAAADGFAQAFGRPKPFLRQYNSTDRAGNPNEPENFGHGFTRMNADKTRI